MINEDWEDIFDNLDLTDTEIEELYMEYEVELYDIMDDLPDEDKCFEKAFIVLLKQLEIFGED